jgi:hypothetical protein
MSEQQSSSYCDKVFQQRTEVGVVKEVKPRPSAGATALSLDS